MKSASYWRDVLMAWQEHGVDSSGMVEFEPEAVERWLANVQRDALEAAALEGVSADPDSSDKWIPERRECAAAIRYLSATLGDP